MKIIQRYLAREIMLAVGLVLTAFLALYIFFDFINELNDVGKHGYQIQHAVIFVLLEIPARAYELLPIAALIGTIYALAQLASRSEFTIMRMSGLTTARAAGMVLLPGLVLVALTYLLGELVTPRAEEQAQKLRLVTSDSAGKGFRTGTWLKDTVVEPGGDSRVRFVNFGELAADHSVKRIKVYEFDPELRLQSIIYAETGEFVEQGEWRLHGVVETRFATPGTAAPGGSAASPADAGSFAAQGPDGADKNIPNRISLSKSDQRIWRSQINPNLLDVMQISPERMAASNLDAYIRHLEENRQKAELYKIAFWKKVIYPLAVLVMMALALPFAYLHARAGGISFKIFAGIMIGIGFYLLNSLFSHLGLLNTWPPFLTAVFPSFVALVAALFALRWVERH